MALGSNANHPIGVEPGDFDADRLGVGRGVKRGRQNVGPEQALYVGCIVALPVREPNGIAFVKGDTGHRLDPYRCELVVVVGNVAPDIVPGLLARTAT